MTFTELTTILASVVFFLIGLAVGCRIDLGPLRGRDRG